MLELGWGEWLSMMASLAVVLVLLAGTLFALKKMGLSNSGNAVRKMRVTEMHNLGNRQKLIMVSVNDEDILLGVTPQAINRLGSWPHISAQMSDKTLALSAASVETKAAAQAETQTGPISAGGGKFKQLFQQIRTVTEGSSGTSGAAGAASKKS